MSLFAKKPRKLFKEEIIEMREMQRIAAGERFKAEVFKKNTAILTVDKGHRGQLEAMLQERRAEVCEQAVRDFVTQKLSQLGYQKGEKVSIVLETGEIKLQPEHDIAGSGQRA